MADAVPGGDGSWRVEGRDRLDGGADDVFFDTARLCYAEFDEPEAHHVFSCWKGLTMASRSSPDAKENDLIVRHWVSAG